MKRTPLRRKAATPRKRGLGQQVEDAAKPRRQAAPTIKSLDALWSELVKLRAARECQLWGYSIRCSTVLNSHHMMSRRHWGTRWEPENGACLCAAHHQWVHNNPILGTEALRDVIGDAQYFAIITQAQDGKKPNAQSRRDIAASLREEIARLKDERQEKEAA